MQPSNKDEKSEADLMVANTKNISLFILLAGDSRLLKAHQAAVDKMLNFWEQHRPTLPSGDEEC